MKSIVDFFIKRSFIVNLVCGFLILAGVVTIFSMQRDLIPPFQWEKVTVNVVINGASPQEMEKYVTFPIEEATQGMRGVERVESTSSAGTSNIEYYFSSGFGDIDQAREMVSTRVNSIRSQLPNSIRQMTIERAQVDSVFLFWLGLENFDEEKAKHRRFADKFIRRLQDVSGVVRVDQGYRKRDISIEFSTEKLKQFEIPLTRARQVINESLSMAPIGTARIGFNDYNVKLDRTAHTLEDLKNLPLRSSRTGNTVFLGDVAEVDWRLEDERSQRFVNGQQGSYLSVRKDINSDMLDVKPKVLKVVEEFNQKSPDDIIIRDLVNGPQFLEKQIDVLVKNGIVGFVLVLIILMCFLNFKTAVMTSLGLPLAYAGAMIVLYLLGINIDLLSIVGMILVIGVLVDDAIIVSERYCDYLDRDYSPSKAASNAVMDLILPVSGTVLTTIVAFAPMIFIQSGLSKILFAVPVVVIAALIMSWVESFFILPNHLAHFVKNKRKATASSPFKRIQRGYEALLGQFLRFRYLSLVFLVGLIVLGGWVGMNKIQHNFRLNIQNERISVYAVLKESESFEQTKKTIAPIENFLQSFPNSEIENTFSSIGSIWMNGRKHEGLQYAKIQAYINRQAKYPTELKAKIQSKINSKIKELKGDNFKKLYSEIEKQESNEVKKQMVSLEVRGDDRVKFAKIEDDIAKRALKYESIKEYTPDPDRFQKSWVFHPETKLLAQYGLSPLTVSQQIRGAFTPHLVKEARMQGDSVNVYMEVDKDEKLSFSRLGNLEVLSSQDIGVPLKLLGEWKKERTLKKINHYNGSRNLQMDFLVANDTNTTAAQKDMAELATKLRQDYPTYEIKALNASEREAESQAWALKVALVCIAGVLLIISMILGSLTQPFLVGLPIPFALVGVIFSLYLNGLPLGVMALVGLVGCIGVSVNASLVMVVEMNKRAGEKGLEKDDIIAGASSRFRAIILTTLTTLGGVFPMAYSLGGESGFTQPLAFALGWGLTFSTLFTLFFIPALMNVREDFFALTRFIFKKVSRKPVDSKKPSVDEQDQESTEDDESQWMPGVVMESDSTKNERTTVQ